MLKISVRQGQLLDHRPKNTAQQGQVLDHWPMNTAQQGQVLDHRPLNTAQQGQALDYRPLNTAQHLPVMQNSVRQDREAAQHSVLEMPDTEELLGPKP